MFRDFCKIFSRSDRWRFGLLVVLMVVAGLVELVTLGAVPLYISLLLGQVSPSELRLCPDVLATWLGNTPASLAIRGGLMLIALYLFRTANVILNNLLQERILRNREIALSTRIFHAYMNAPWAMVRRINSSTIVDYVPNEVERLIDLFLSQLLTFLRNLIVTIAILVLLLAHSPMVSLATFLVLGVSAALVMYAMNRRIHQLGARALDLRQGIVKNVTEGAGAFKEATVLGCKKHFEARLHRALEGNASVRAVSNAIQKSIWPAMELLTVMVILGTMLLLFGMGHTIDTIAPTLALLTVCLARLKGLVTEMMLCYNNIRYNAPVLANVANHVRTFEQVQQPSEKHLDFDGDISVQDLSFTFPDAEAPVLQNVSFRIPKGSSAAFVGPTGAGKSTMADLLLGLYRPSAGQITVGNQDISQSVSDWQRLIGYVPQDIFLLDASIRENIALGYDDHDIDDAALRSAIHAAQLDSLIDSLPDGDRTVIGEKGLRLSGGQRQRIGIARALYRNPPVLVFDEATSSLDNETEAAVSEAIAQLRGNHTILLVAHRLNTVRACSQILYFDHATATRFASLDDLAHEHPSFVAASNKS
ncbi:MAG: ABC transporter ATP-binding protein [Victivallales bacterium]|nr:ABC transporter ATP-binding protein [Victivallales bacterium]